MIALATPRNSVSELFPARTKLSRRTLLMARESKLLDALNDAARAKVRLALAGEETPDWLAKELAAAVKRYSVELTPEAYLTLAEVFDRQDRFAGAARCYRKALQLCPDDVDVLNNLGVALGKAGKFRDGAVHLRKAAQLRKNDAHLQNNLGWNLLWSGDYPGAEAALQMAHTADPSYPAPLMNLGYLRHERGDHDAAVEMFRRASAIGDEAYRAIRIKPGDAPLLMGRCLIEVGRHEDALAAFSSALARGCVRSQGLLWKAAALTDLKRPVEANACLRALEREADAATAAAAAGDIDALKKRLFVLTRDEINTKYAGAFKRLAE